MTARVLAVLLTAVVLTVTAVGAVGVLVLMRTTDDPVEHADAVLVLGGEHDGREQFGVQLARRLSAGTLVLSNPYRRTDAVMRTMCARRTDGLEVICAEPVPSTTRGEALLVRRLAAAHGWRRIAVVSWRYHLPRARLIFERCDPIPGGSVEFVSVPRDYDYSVESWLYTFGYQSVSLAKARLQGDC